MKTAAWAFGVFAAAAWAQAPVTLTIDPRVPGVALPADVLGSSFESSNLLPGPVGEHLLSEGNKPLISLFRTLGIRSLRVGGDRADTPQCEEATFACWAPLLVRVSGEGQKALVTEAPTKNFPGR